MKASAEYRKERSTKQRRRPGWVYVRFVVSVDGGLETVTLARVSDSIKVVSRDEDATCPKRRISKP